MSGVNKLRATKIRRERVIERLEAQLKSGVKPVEVKHLKNVPNPNDIGDGTVPLTESDVKRIKKELVVVATRI